MSYSPYGAREKRHRAGHLDRRPAGQAWAGPGRRGRAASGVTTPTTVHPPRDPARLPHPCPRLRTGLRAWAARRQQLDVHRFDTRRHRVDAWSTTPRPSRWPRPVGRCPGVHRPPASAIPHSPTTASACGPHLLPGSATSASGSTTRPPPIALSSDREATHQLTPTEDGQDEDREDGQHDRGHDRRHVRAVLPLERPRPARPESSERAPAVARIGGGDSRRRGASRAPVAADRGRPTEPPPVHAAGRGLPLWSARSSPQPRALPRGSQAPPARSLRSTRDRARRRPR